MVVWRRQNVARMDALNRTCEGLAKGQERLETLVREEMAGNRRESDEQARAARDEANEAALKLVEQFGVLQRDNLNCVYDADIDQRMRRTRRRALPRHLVSRRAALWFGLALGLVSTLWLGLLVNWLSAGLALAANLFYVVGYTMVLKRRTAQNIVWGGAAGCFPALIGWTAVTGELAWPPVVLFGVVFLWTPPHFWALAIRYREDYAAADVPMLPVRGGRPQQWLSRILVYSYADGRRPRCCCGRSPGPAGCTRWWRSFSASRSSVESHRLLARASAGGGAGHGGTGGDGVVALRPMRLFHWSNTYLTLLFVARSPSTRCCCH